MSVTVRVRGEFACFTRPETKVDRVSYPVMTPPAAQGIVEAIFWKPEITWQVQAIDVLAPIRWITVRRNEVKHRQWSRSPMTVDEDRTQRSSVLLRDVDYVITAEPIPRPHVAHEDPQKYRAQFLRRVERGQCFHRPYLGIREYAATFEPPGSYERISQSFDIGPMILGIFTPDGAVDPTFFHARLDQGRLKVPSMVEAT